VRLHIGDRSQFTISESWRDSMGIFTSSNPVLGMLKADHEKVKTLFAQFEEAKDSRTKARIVLETLLELDVHAKLEETLIYPAIRQEIEAEDIMDEALEEHHVAHTLINELKRMTPADARFDAKFTVLGESIKHHVQEEEGQMFPEAEKADLPWEDLQQKAMKQKEALMARFSGNGRAARSGARKSGKARSGSRKAGRKRAGRSSAGAKR
jgi:hemerythrin superfamily protein